LNQSNSQVSNLQKELQRLHEILKQSGVKVSENVLNAFNKKNLATNAKSVGVCLLIIFFSFGIYFNHESSSKLPSALRTERQPIPQVLAPRGRVLLEVPETEEQNTLPQELPSSRIVSKVKYLYSKTRPTSSIPKIEEVINDPMPIDDQSISETALDSVEIGEAKTISSGVSRFVPRTTIPVTQEEDDWISENSTKFLYCSEIIEPNIVPTESGVEVSRIEAEPMPLDPSQPTVTLLIPPKILNSSFEGFPDNAIFQVVCRIQSITATTYDELEHSSPTLAPLYV